MSLSVVWTIRAVTYCEPSSRRAVLSTVVLPVPISPVMTTKLSWFISAKRTLAAARECCPVMNRNLGSGARSNGRQFSWKK